VTEDALLDDPASAALTQGELITLFGNLVDNAIGAARADAPGWV
jgi:sensor histidine kinase regulating citrate/malate metabolism